MLCLFASRSDPASGASLALDACKWMWNNVCWAPVLAAAVILAPQQLGHAVIMWFGVQLLVLPVGIVAKHCNKNTHRLRVARTLLRCLWTASDSALACFIFIPYIHVNGAANLADLLSCQHQEPINKTCIKTAITICQEKDVAWHEFSWMVKDPAAFAAQDLVQCMDMKRMALQITWLLPILLCVMRPGPVMSMCARTRALTFIYTLLAALQGMDMETQLLTTGRACVDRTMLFRLVLTCAVVLLATQLLQQLCMVARLLPPGDGQEKEERKKRPLVAYRTVVSIIGIAAIELVLMGTRMTDMMYCREGQTNVHWFRTLSHRLDWWIVKDCLMLIGLILLVSQETRCRWRSREDTESGTTYGTLASADKEVELKVLKDSESA